MKKTSSGRSTPLTLALPFPGCVVWEQATPWLGAPASRGPGSCEPSRSGCTGFSAASAAAKENSHSRAECAGELPRFSFDSDGKWSLPGVGGPWLPSRPGLVGGDTFFRPDLWKTVPAPGRALVKVSRHLWNRTFMRAWPRLTQFSRGLLPPSPSLPQAAVDIWPRCGGQGCKCWTHTRNILH